MVGRQWSRPGAEQRFKGREGMLFVHLSDIHFMRSSGGVFDPDEDVRNELLLDAQQVASELGAPDGLLVSGDIAFSGQRNEYDIAKNWLAQLSEAVGCETAAVLTVPGNHDVDRNSIKATAADLRANLRTLAFAELNDKLHAYAGDPVAEECFWGPIGEYNLFTQGFGCTASADRPVWEKEFPLCDGVVLRIHGLNSTLVSDDTDDEHQKVILGEHQIPQRKLSKLNTVEMILCHHPPDWWFHREHIEPTINSRIQLQLFGHKHTHSLERIDNSVKIVTTEN